jgi:hypothetical protein
MYAFTWLVLLGTLKIQKQNFDGGEIVQPVGVDAPEITARFHDPAGNVIGLYQQPNVSAPAGEEGSD